MGGQRRNSFAAMKALCVYSRVIFSQFSFRQSSSPKNTRDETRAMTLRMVSRNGIECHSDDQSALARSTLKVPYSFHLFTLIVGEVFGECQPRLIYKRLGDFVLCTINVSHCFNLDVWLYILKLFVRSLRTTSFKIFESRVPSRKPSNPGYSA